ncbi:hypothetical protein [Enterobacter cloacae]|uniref:hypothetical protein n=1 Tax=Enterobacter cloacae TaxID=550 RepID=UPI000B8D67E9|nr:hypothetical protein [Enterobacter cloacae]ASQ15822.1 hypothetical protein BJM06_a00178 [Enterobacter cloacae]
MSIYCDDKFFMLGIHSTILDKLRSIPEDVYIITSCSAMKIYYFSRLHSIKGVVFCSERALRLLCGVVNGKLYNLNELFSFPVLEMDRNKRLPQLSSQEEKLLKLFAGNRNTRIKMLILDCDYKKLNVIHLRVRKKLQCNNDVELYFKLLMMKIGDV